MKRLALASFFLSRTLICHSLTLGVGESATVQISGLKEVAITSAKVARARVIPPQTLLLTALAPGSTMVRAWALDAEEKVIELEVVPREVSPRQARRESSEGLVRVSLEFLEIDRSLGQALGVRWPDKIQFNFQAFLSGDSQYSGLNYGSNFSTAQGWLSALVQSGNARLLAAPEIYVRLGEEANFHSGGEFPVPLVSENFGRMRRDIQWKPYGMTVKVRPMSGDRFHFGSDIHIDISELNPSRSTEGIPALSKRSLTTKITSMDGETVILSGLIRDASTESQEGVPFLSTIPLLGRLFSVQSENRDQTEVLMAVNLSFSTKGLRKETIQAFKHRFRAKKDSSDE